MGSSIFWHGTPADIASEDVRSRPSFLDAVWLSGAPEIAAHYAGADGWVHGFVLAPDVSLLAATGHRHRPLPYAYPDADLWERVSAWLGDQGYDLDGFDCLNRSKVERGFQPPLGADGQPSWEGLFGDLSEVDGTGEDLLSLMGMDGILQSERVHLALSDRRHAGGDENLSALIGSLEGRADEPVATVGVLSHTSLVPVCRLRARDVTLSYLAGTGIPATTAADVARWLGRPSVVATSPRP